MLHELATFHKNEVSRLHNVLEYLVDLNRCRIGALKQGFNIVGQPEVLEADISASLLPPKAMGLDALDFLKSFAPAHYVPLFDESNVDQQTFTGIIQGANFTAAVVKWLSHCRWPPDIQNDYKRSDDWGISWLEIGRASCRERV